MGSVYQRKGRDGWFAWWRDATGRERTKRLTAQTKTEAKRLLLEIERQVERQRLGLEQLPTDSTMTLWDLCDWWLKSRCPPASAYRERNRLGLYIGKDPIGALPLPRVTHGVIDERLAAMTKAGLSARSVNSLRRVLGTVYRRAIAAEKWSGPNPIERVAKRDVTKRAYATLSPEEIPIVLANAGPRWRGPIAVAVYAALRKGEVIGLRRQDVDLQNRIMVVRHSYDAETTKGKRHDTIPIAEPLVPHLQQALDSARGERLFPLDEGSEAKQAGSGIAPEKALRKILARAGIVEGWDHICRRCKAAKRKPHTWRFPDAVIRRCETCDMQLWPKAIPRPMRFHDLRHTTATVLLRSGVPAHVVQLIMRHQSVETTTAIYGHMTVEDLRGALSALPSSPVPAMALPTKIPAKKKGRTS